MFVDVQREFVMEMGLMGRWGCGGCGGCEGEIWLFGRLLMDWSGVVVFDGLDAAWLF